MKKKILLVWWYDRLDLIKPYLEMTNEFEITVLFYRFPHQENLSVAEKLPFRRIYWLDYVSPYQLLKDTQPEKILFFGVESVLTICLIAAAKIKKIPTVYISHGLRGSLEEVIKNSNEPTSVERYQKTNKDYNEKKWHTLVFLFLTFSFNKISSIKFIIEVFKSEIFYKNTFEKLKFIRSSLRKVDEYYLYAPENALLFNELDEPNRNNIFYTGPYIIDSIFKELLEYKDFPEKDYWLLIDQPVNILEYEQKNNFYNKLANIAQKNNKKLFVKLHPMDFDKISNVQHPNIEWIKEHHQVAQLIMEASGVIGFFSTLLLPIICYKKCILFETNSNNLVKKWADINVIKRLDIQQFEEKDLNFDSLYIDEKFRQNFIDRFIVYTDGKSSERLKFLIQK